MARSSDWRSWSRFWSSVNSGLFSNHLAASASAATPWLVRPSGSETRTLITACVASVTVITPKRKASRIFTCRS